MEFSQHNEVIQLCSRGMESEGKGLLTEAKNLFDKAWKTATTDFEKFTAAHYMARHQPDIQDKLNWDKTALMHALKINDNTVKAVLPSLYLNIAKGYEDLNDTESASRNYEAALSFTSFLMDDGYGKLIKAGITKGLERVRSSQFPGD